MYEHHALAGHSVRNVDEAQDCQMLLQSQMRMARGVLTQLWERNSFKRKVSIPMYLLLVEKYSFSFLV